MGSSNYYALFNAALGALFGATLGFVLPERFRRALMSQFLG